MRFLSFATIFLGFTAPAAAELYPVKEGDVFCVGYDKTSNSCSSVQTVKIVDEGEYFILELAGFSFGKTKLDMLVTSEAFEKNEEICIRPSKANVAITPKESSFAEGWQNMMQYQLDELIEQEMCVEHRQCGDGWVSIASVAGEVRRDLSATFHVFEADDPRSKSAQPRYLGMEEINTMKKKVDACFGEDT